MTAPRITAGEIAPRPLKPYEREIIDLRKENDRLRSELDRLSAQGGEVPGITDDELDDLLVWTKVGKPLRPAINCTQTADAINALIRSRVRPAPPHPDTVEVSREEWERSFLRDLVLEIEDRHFRTIHDTGAVGQAQMILATLRMKLGLPYLGTEDLPAPIGREYVMPEGSNLLREIERRAQAQPATEEPVCTCGCHTIKGIIHMSACCGPGTGKRRPDQPATEREGT